MDFNKKEIRILSITLTSISIIFIGTGLIMSFQKPKIKTTYSLSIENRKIAESQAKTNEIKIKDLEIEINHPISMDVKDYLNDIENISNDTLKSLKLDTSLVNINQAGTYKYTITYKKKKYIGTIKIKEKELPNMTLTLKEITLKRGESLSSNPRTFIKEEIPEEVFNNLTLDISNVKPAVSGTYDYYIIYKGITYQGKIIITEPGPTIITPKDQCPKDTKMDNGKCTCTDINKIYDDKTKTCIDKPKTEENTDINQPQSTNQ